MLLSWLKRLLKKSRPLSRSAQRRSLTLEVLEDRTVPTFLSAATLPVGVDPRAVTVADFNNDGKPDLAVLNAGSSSASQSSLSVLLGNGDGSFKPAVTTAVQNSGAGQGNAVSLTQTVNTLFGSLITVPGTGIVLNNEMDDFSISPTSPNAWNALGSAANAIRPGKRPLSSMTPTIVLQDGRVRYVVGSPMGTVIISAVLQTLLGAVDFKLDPQQAVSAPRFHHQWMPDQLMVEGGHPRDVLEKLRAWGRDVQPSPYPLGAVQLIARDPASGAWLGATDPRRDGAAVGY